MFSTFYHLVFIAAVFVTVAPGAFGTPPDSDAATELRTEYEVLSTAFAETVPGGRPIEPATGSLLYIAPDQYTPAGANDDAYRDARHKYADSLFELAKRAADAGQLSLAFGWATEAVCENPDHDGARRVLGYHQREGRWLTPWAIRMAAAGQTWHPKYGWIAPDDLPRYEAGERLDGSHWIDADTDAARHANIEDGWQVRTDHFLVTSNHSLQAAVSLAARLEQLYQVWQQLFAGFCFSEREVRQLFAGQRDARQRNKPFRVFYHRDKDDYVSALRRRQPRIAETLGIYFDADREAHFFAGEQEDAGTLYHEAVHQLFQETRPAVRPAGQHANFWIIEGVATYFETLRERRDSSTGPYFTIGQWSAGRLPAARRRLLDENYYIPLAILVGWGKDELQRQTELVKIYSQAAGQAAFLMDAGHARYREALVRYLRSVYAGRDNLQTLSAQTGASYAQLDAEYRKFLQSLP